MKKLFGSIVGLILGVVSAHASIVQVTYSGTVVAGSDARGIFGTINTGVEAYVGQSYVAQYVFDTSRATGAFARTSPDNNFVFGGADFVNLSPATSAQVSVNGHTFSFNPIAYSQLSGTSQTVDANVQKAYARLHVDSSHDTLLDSYVRANDLGPYTVPLTITENFTYHVLPGQTSISQFITVGGYVTANIDTLTIRDITTGVPEPSTWALMILGLAGVGFAARRQRRSLRNVSV
ncbi:PEPxxWA-CTERM sorting domain-containing protein [Bradyrhizobium sp.]|uniref:PEPxxWA-CTERM sorting domain-containing protein n=1 Tax=Bradyrhizobium sp. TaxID=376 RepID=UPI00238BBCA6|nr:PEPxxWA-CTERM sorting domain-containing protein [Bradyrhizobium sp.]MDE2377079.1 PEP-CTERM sorting domain-containing protein [Bradyrhizobium sp.]